MTFVEKDSCWGQLSPLFEEMSKFLIFHPWQELDGTNSINGGEGNFGASGRDRLNLTTNPVHI